MTLLSNALAEEHDIPIGQLEAEAAEYIRVSDAHLFRFFDRPEDWETGSSLGALRLSIPAIFNIDTVRSQIAHTKTFPELLAITSAWR